jgi:hypothetical protein
MVTGGVEDLKPLRNNIADISVTDLNGFLGKTYVWRPCVRGENCNALRGALWCPKVAQRTHGSNGRFGGQDR